MRGVWGVSILSSQMQMAVWGDVANVCGQPQNNLTSGS